MVIDARRFGDFRVAKRALTATGVAFAVGIGYIDPGNWSTDLNATTYGNALLWSIIASGIAAILLQVLVVRVAASSRTDLVSDIRNRWPRTAAWLWPVYAFSIFATETAEFTGVTLGIELVFHVGLGAALGLSALAFFVLLAARGTAARPLERFAILTTLLVAIVFAIDWFALHPAAGPIVRGSLVPSLAGPGALAAVIGIIGATIMPHNLFLHGGLVTERLEGAAHGERANIARFALKETVIALGIATLINAAILIVGNAAHATTIEAEFAALHATLGSASAVLFGGALMVTGLAATATGARAGDFVFGPGALFRLTPFVRRVLGIAPPALLLAYGCSAATLLFVSQIALGLALPFVMAPLLLIASREMRRATFAGRSLFAGSAVVAVTTVACDGNFLLSLIPR